MDLREKKTKRSIVNAFLQLRKTKPLERIIIKELSELAEISKATFYLHYKDIYDLSEQLQEEVIQNVLNSITHPENYLNDRYTFTKELFYAFYSEQSLIETLFSDSQNAVLPMRIEIEMRKFIHKQCPDMSKEDDMRLTYDIYGGYYVYQVHRKSSDINDIIKIVSENKA